MPRTPKISKDPEFKKKEDAIRKIFSDNLRRYLKENGLSQAKLAELCDCSTDYVNKVVNGHYHFFRFKFVYDCSRVFQVPVFMLFAENARRASEGIMKMYFKYLGLKEPLLDLSMHKEEPVAEEKKEPQKRKPLIRGNYFGG